MTMDINPEQGVRWVWAPGPTFRGHREQLCRLLTAQKTGGEGECGCNLLLLTLVGAGCLGEGSVVIPARVPGDPAFHAPVSHLD